MTAHETIDFYTYPPLSPAILELELDINFSVGRSYPQTWESPAELGDIDLGRVRVRSALVCTDVDMRPASKDELSAIRTYVEGQVESDVELSDQLHAACEAAIAAYNPEDDRY